MSRNHNHLAPSAAFSASEVSPAAQGQSRRKLYVKSFGCQMNVYDAQKMADLLAPEGYDEAAFEGDADLVILNTCHIRERASEKVFSELGKVALYKRQRAAAGLDTKIVVAGCVAQAEGGEILRRQKAVDVVVGPQSYHHLPELLRQASGIKTVDTDFPIDDKFAFLTPATREKTAARGFSAFVTVQEGCDKFCSFCVVPYTRGAEMSRPVAAIIAEVEDLVAAGVREIILLGQNVNAYHGVSEAGGISSFGQLCHRLAEISGIARIRYTTSHPNDMDADLIAAHRDLPQLMPFLHLPVQSGSDRILAAMNRKHTRGDYIRLIAEIRAARPDIALSSDFIVGFPGETDADFEATLDLIADVGFASGYFFKYSQRPGTPGADLPDQVEEAVKCERLARLQTLVESQHAAFNQNMLHRRVDVLFEKDGRHTGQLGGKSPYFQAVHVEAPRHLLGEIHPVEIVGIGTNSLYGRLLSPKGSSEVMA